MRTSKSRAWHMLVLFPVMFCAFAMIFYVAFMLTWPLYSITEVDFDIHSKTANPGGIILYDVHLCGQVLGDPLWAAGGWQPWIQGLLLRGRRDRDESIRVHGYHTTHPRTE